MNKKRLLINLTSNIISFALQLGISFILTPIITEKVGDAAYGFIGLANNFVSYANIFTVIINSMASRFVTYEMTKGNNEKANKYYSSVFIIDIIMSIAIGIISFFLIINIQDLIEVPIELTLDVKITFALAFANLILSIMSTIFTVATYVKNRLEIEAIRNIIGNIIRAIFLVIVFSLCTPKIYFIPLGALLMTIFVLIANIKITKDIAPELKLSTNFFDKESIKTLAKSGIWNSINNLSKTLLTGLDLLIANLFIGADAMGLLSIAKTIPTNVESLLSTMANIFSPQFIVAYSKHRIRELINNVNFSTKIIALIMIVPIAGIIAFGTDFFTLWLPSKTAEEINQIQVLSILSLLPYILSVNNYTLFILDTTTNKLKRPVIATSIMSIVSTITTIILLITTDLGIYAVAGVSSIYWCIKIIFFNTINAAKNLRIRWNTFFEQFLKNTVCLLIVLGIYTLLKRFIQINSWLQFIEVVLPLGIIGYIFVFLVLFNKEEKKIIFKIVKNKIGKITKK